MFGVSFSTLNGGSVLLVHLEQTDHLLNVRQDSAIALRPDFVIFLKRISKSGLFLLCDGIK